MSDPRSGQKADMTTQRILTSQPRYAHLADLPLAVERVSWQQHELGRGDAWTRITTEVVLHGDGHQGHGEDVIYSVDDQRAFPPHLESIAPRLAGAWTLDAFCEEVASIDLFPSPLEYPEQAPYRRWALESAALDLALRQAGTHLAELLHATPQPLRFCISMALGDEPSADRIRAWLAADAGMEFKLDATRAWSEQLMRELADTQAVRVIDLKGHYRGDWIDNTPDPLLYARIAAYFPDAWIEDALLDDDTRHALREATGRLAWDAPIHSLDDVLALPDPPGAINIKPSRFGSIRGVLDTIDWCMANDVPLYGGGQFELGVGRVQAQELARIFYPGQPNDIAPVTYHSALPGDAVPPSPLPVPSALPGFGRCEP